MHDRRFNPAEAHRLEDPERLIFMPPDDVVACLEMAPGMTVADVGAGTGYFTIPIAKAVQPGGRVYAVDAQTEMLRLLDAKLGAPSAPDNIVLVEGEAADTRLPQSACDRVLIANVWHELDDHDGVLREAARILKPEGRVAILDWRADVPARSHGAPRAEGDPPGPPQEHRIPETAVAEGLRNAGWRVITRANVGQYSYIVIAER